ncbi:MAG: transposase [Candidatus Saganbacteria bacterium]|nr:transposase [Candidatus Saganbacteria bacterium]
MARLARVVAVGYPHHITQRGNNKQRIFTDNNDRWKYLFLLIKYCRKYKLAVLSYCLMPNHIHLIAIPKKPDSLAKLINCAHMQYAQYLNEKIGACGHLWHQRFFSCILDGPHLLRAARYIERNPVRAKMAKEAWDWKWSSARHHVGKEKKDNLIRGNLFDYINMEPKDWAKHLRENEDEKFIEKLKHQTKRGRPLCAKEFIRKLEAKTGKDLQLRPKGRPRKINGE